MNLDRNYDWSARTAAQIVNLHLDPGTCKAITFQKITFLIYEAIRLSNMETREIMLLPSKN